MAIDLKHNGNIEVTNGVITIDGSPVGGGLEGTQYVFVTANGTDTENATELQNAYNTAKTMSPSATNRITIVAGIGNYNFGSSSFDMDTQYIDLVSLDGNRSVIFNATLNSSSAATRTQGSINITANDVFVKGVDVTDKRFTIGDNLNLLKVENCKGDTFSFGGLGTASGTFTNCQGAFASFGGGSGTASGTFNNCEGGNDSFGGGSGTASGTFNNCEGGNDSFGGIGFGGGGTASGTFTNCIAGNDSFAGGLGTASGTFNNCEGGNGSFAGGSGTASGIFTNCKGGFNSFGAGGTALGTFTNCVGDAGSFQPLSGNLSFSKLLSNSLPFGNTLISTGGIILGSIEFAGTGSDVFITKRP